MNKIQFDNEKKYLATMMMARNLLEQGALSETEYCEIDTKYQKIYSVSLSSIITDINLIKPGTYGNM